MRFPLIFAATAFLIIGSLQPVHAETWVHCADEGESGTAPDNDQWIRRESDLTLRRHHASLLVGEQFRAKGRTVSPEFGLDPPDHAAHGGGFPVRVAGVGVVAAITVSGLVSEEDHRLVTDTSRAYLKV